MLSGAVQMLLDKLRKHSHSVGLQLARCQMWLRVFSHPELALEVLEELAPVYGRSTKGDKEVTAGEEPA